MPQELIHQPRREADVTGELQAHACLQSRVMSCTPHLRVRDRSHHFHNKKLGSHSRRVFVRRPEAREVQTGTGRFGTALSKCSPAPSPRVFWWKMETELRAAQGVGGPPRAPPTRCSSQSTHAAVGTIRTEPRRCPVALLSGGSNPKRRSRPTRQTKSVWEGGGNPEWWGVPGRI